jgi:hypothetical protein
MKLEEDFSIFRRETIENGVLYPVEVADHRLSAGQDVALEAVAMRPSSTLSDVAQRNRLSEDPYAGGVGAEYLRN